MIPSIIKSIDPLNNHTSGLNFHQIPLHKEGGIDASYLRETLYSQDTNNSLAIMVYAYMQHPPNYRGAKAILNFVL